MQNEHTIDNLKQFIDVAEKNRKYVPSSATSFRVALAIFEAELNEEEKGSIEKFKQNIEPIYLNVVRKNQNYLSSSTMQEYKRRIVKILRDYEQYGIDPSKMTIWTPTQRIRVKKEKNLTQKVKGVGSMTHSTDPEKENPDENDSGTTMSRHQIGLRPNIRASIVVPYDLSKAEAGKIKKFIEYLESIAE